MRAPRVALASRRPGATAGSPPVALPKAHAGGVRALVAASARALPRRAVALHLAAVVALLAATWSGLDAQSTALPVLRGVAVLLAAALALALDEAGAALLDSSPTPLRTRVGVRAALCAALVLPLWVGALGVVAVRGGGVPAGAVTLELLALVALALAVPAALRRWRRIAAPALVAGPLLLGVLLAAAHLPRDVRLLVSTPLDPAWEAAHWRWAGLLVLAAAVLVRALAEPATARVPGRRRSAS